MNHFSRNPLSVLCCASSHPAVFLQQSRPHQNYLIFHIKRSKRMNAIFEEWLKRSDQMKGGELDRFKVWERELVGYELYLDFVYSVVETLCNEVKKKFSGSGKEKARSPLPPPLRILCGLMKGDPRWRKKMADSFCKYCKDIVLPTIEKKAKEAKESCTTPDSLLLKSRFERIEKMMKKVMEMTNAGHPVREWKRKMDDQKAINAVSESTMKRFGNRLEKTKQGTNKKESKIMEETTVASPQRCLYKIFKGLKPFFEHTPLAFAYEFRDLATIKDVRFFHFFPLNSFFFSELGS